MRLTQKISGLPSCLKAPSPQAWCGSGQGLVLGMGRQGLTGVGVLLGLGALEETRTMVSLSGVPLDLMGLAIDEARQGQPGRIWLALLIDNRKIIADPVQGWRQTNANQSLQRQ